MTQVFRDASKDAGYCSKCQKGYAIGPHVCPTEQVPSRFNDVPRLLDWTGNGGSPFDVASLHPRTLTLIVMEECVLNVEGARALRDWLNKVIPS